MYTALIRAQDREGILEKLTNQAVEDSVVERVRLKAATFGQDLSLNQCEATNGVHNLVFFHFLSLVEPSNQLAFQLNLVSQSECSTWSSACIEYDWSELQHVSQRR